MGLDRKSLEDNILQFVRSRCPNVSLLSPDTDLLEAGVLDSLLLVDLIVHVENLCGTQLRSEHIGPQNFRSVGAIVDLATSQLRAPSQT